MRLTGMVWILLLSLSVLSCKTASFKGDGASKQGKGNETLDPKPVDPKPVDPKPVDPTPPLFVECPEHPDHKLVAGLYLLPQDTPNLPDFTKMTKVKDVCLKQLDVTDRDFNEGFPGIENLIEWFGLDINFRVNVPADGEYNFTLNSDDGSTMDIDDKRVIENDGLHPHKEVSGKATLTKGYHSFKVRYYEGPRYRIALELFWVKPGDTTRGYIPEDLFERPVVK